MSAIDPESPVCRFIGRLVVTTAIEGIRRMKLPNGEASGTDLVAVLRQNARRAGNCRLHVACLLAWELERREREPAELSERTDRATITAGEFGGRSKARPA